MTVENKPLEVLVIGAGVAGLSAAIALGKQGHRVTILEKSSFLKETGAAIHLPPNCTALLRWMGVDPTEFGGTLLHEIHRYGSAGDLKYKKEFAGIRHIWQDEWYLVHRVDLHNHLKQQALKGAILHTKCTITSINIDATRPSITLDDGRRFEADLLLGADGLHSQVRGAIAPRAPAPYQVGKSCFRWLLPTKDLQKHDCTREFVQKEGIFIEWASDTCRLVAYPCSNSKVYNLCAFVPSREVEFDTQADGWQTVGDKDTIIRMFSNFTLGVRKMVEEADDKLKVWDMFDMEALPTWTKGTAALIGDAAHPFQPYMGQGGAMAIEDAVGVATLLPLGTRAEDIPARLKLYETNRRPRVELVLEYTRLNGRDENDTAGARITRESSSILTEKLLTMVAGDMVKIMGMIFLYNEIEQCKNLLAGQ
ncbi:uncharacterized protein N7484_012011 [Penicillium longicatenatum]|uniref:uncharacterized protein n=1 Tax=Penicillium longicatenatum TaxID=1561947 RepID=UPI0025476C48|nr:uncharacterized protein N7484_012011 [Penicillium longicatenatum]KAJ5631911.1 hypothetical protein N7484_012011 [Penicillium longicatenatum]